MTASRGTFPTLSTGNRSAKSLSLTLVSESAFARIPRKLRKPSDRAQVILYANYPGLRHQLAIKLDMDTTAKLGQHLCDIADDAKRSAPARSVSLAEKFRNARIEAGMSQTTLADMANVTISTIQNVERGRFFPQRFTAMSIAEALGMSLEDVAQQQKRDRPKRRRARRKTA